MFRLLDYLMEWLLFGAASKAGVISLGAMLFSGVNSWFGATGGDGAERRRDEGRAL
jgi:hypothetical protein